MEHELPTTKPALHTTEFWLTTIPVILYLVKAFTGRDTDGVDIAGLALLAAGISTAGYAIARSMTKRATTFAQATVLQTRMGIVHDTQVQSIARAHDLQLQQMRSAPPA
jgi:hypothetical protein